MVTPTSSTKTLKLRTGAEIPQIGLGTWKSPGDQCYKAVLAALRDGYRHIDTARVYGNEEYVGKAVNDFIAESGVPRSEIFVTTKFWCTEFKEPVTFVKASLARLNLEYVDLLLMHWPVPMKYKGDELLPKEGAREMLPFEEFNYLDTYKGMQQLLDLGYTKAIGISNFNLPKVQRLLADKEVTVPPAALQIELHPYLPQQELVDFCTKNNIVVEAYSPLGSSGAPLLKEKVIREIAEKHEVSPATVVISWAVQRGTVVLPKSVNPVRVASNRKIIELSSADMAALGNIHKTFSKRFCDPVFNVNVFTSGYDFK